MGLVYVEKPLVLLPELRRPEVYGMITLNTQSQTITLQRIAMRVPNRAGIYMPSRTQKPTTVDYNEFLEKYTNYVKSVKVRFASNERWYHVTAYKNGMFWYIVC